MLPDYNWYNEMIWNYTVAIEWSLRLWILRSEDTIIIWYLTGVMEWSEMKLLQFDVQRLNCYDLVVWDETGIKKWSEMKLVQRKGLRWKWCKR